MPRSAVSSGCDRHHGAITIEGDGQSPISDRKRDDMHLIHDDDEVESRST